MAERKKRPVPQSFEEYEDDLVGPRRRGRSASVRRDVEDDEEELVGRRIQAPRLRRRGRDRRSGDRESLKALVRDIPNFLKLLGRLARDPRVSAADKAIVGAAIAYLFVPADLIPDWIPALGEIEDVFLLALALSRLLNNAGIDVLMDHWDGDMASLEAALSALDRAGSLLPEPVRGLLGGRHR